MAARLGKISALVANETGSDSNLREYRAKAHLLHVMAGRSRNVKDWTGGCIYPAFFVEGLPGHEAKHLGWTEDAGYQCYTDEMGLETLIISKDDVVVMVGLWCGLAQGSRRPKMRKVGTDEARRRHIMKNHQPFRRDCALCLRNGGVGRQHRATPSPRAYVLSIDVELKRRRKRSGRRSPLSWRRSTLWFQWRGGGKHQVFCRHCSA